MVGSEYRIMSLTAFCRHQGARRWAWLGDVKGNKIRSRHTLPRQLHLGYLLTQFLSSSVCLDGKILHLSKSHLDLSKALLCLSIRSPHLGLPWLGLRRHGTFIILMSLFVIPGFCFLLLFFSFALSQGRIRGLLFLKQNSFCVRPGVHLLAPKQLAEVFPEKINCIALGFSWDLKKFKILICCSWNFLSIVVREGTSMSSLPPLKLSTLPP